PVGQHFHLSRLPLVLHPILNPVLHRRQHYILQRVLLLLIYECSDYATSTSSLSAGPSRKRSRSSATSIPSRVHTVGALSPAQADLLPPQKRYKGTSATHSYEYSDGGS
ncbi:hypothetical protein Tco_0278971, partial [Tanacetum coccineum]